MNNSEKKKAVVQLFFVQLMKSVWEDSNCFLIFFVVVVSSVRVPRSLHANEKTKENLNSN